jgi:hypothetical protein
MKPATSTAVEDASPADTLSDEDLVESIIYLASLASQPGVIDSSLDTLRKVTARWTPPEPLPPADRTALESLTKDIKNYLITSDRLRDFTEEALERRLQLHRNSVRRGRSPVISFWRVLLVSLLLAGATVIVPSPLAVVERIFIATLGFMMLLALWNAWFYLSALHNFKPDLQRAFDLFCVGVVVLGMQFAHFARLGFSDLIVLPFFKYGGFTLLAFVGLTLIYLGLRRYAKIVGIKSIFLSLPLFIGESLVAALAVMGFAFVSDVSHPLFFGLTMVGSATSVVSCVYSAFLARSIARNVTASYAHPMQWLYMFHVIGSLGAAGFTIAIGVLMGVSGTTLGIVLGICGVPPIMILAYSGYLFKKETSK